MRTAGTGRLHAAENATGLHTVVELATVTHMPALSQAAAQRFVDAYEALLQRVAAEPTASLPGFEGQPFNCISLSVLR